MFSGWWADEKSECEHRIVNEYWTKCRSWCEEMDSKCKHFWTTWYSLPDYIMINLPKVPTFLCCICQYVIIVLYVFTSFYVGSKFCLVDAEVWIILTIDEKERVKRRERERVRFKSWWLCKIESYLKLDDATCKMHSFKHRIFKWKTCTSELGHCLPGIGCLPNNCAMFIQIIAASCQFRELKGMKKIPSIGRGHS